jgi:hypothetical protein
MEVTFMPTPNKIEVFAVHRQTSTGGVNLPPGGLPPVVTLALNSGKYLVTAKLLVMNMSTQPHQVSCTLRPRGTAGTPYDTSEVRLSPRWQAGEMNNLVLHCVIDLPAAGGIDVDCGHTGAIGDIRAEHIWMSALKIDSVKKIELT